MNISAQLTRADHRRIWDDVFPNTHVPWDKPGWQTIKRNPLRDDDKTPSFRLNTDTGGWIDNGKERKTGDSCTLVAMKYRISMDSQEMAREIERIIGRQLDHNGNGQRPAAPGPIKQTAPRPAPAAPPEKKPEKTYWTPRPDDISYSYSDEHGNYINTKIRRGDGKDKVMVWEWKNKPVSSPYRLADVMRATLVAVFEGEKDAETGTALGLCGTTSPDGGASWKDSCTPYFAGKDILLFYDRDETGEKRRDDTLKKLSPVAKSIRVIELQEKDLTDWVATKPDTTAARDELLGIIERTPVYVPPAQEMKIEDWLYRSDPGKWATIDIADVDVWKDDPLEWTVDPIIPARTVGFLGAAPKTGKSLLIADLLLHLANPCRAWLGKFSCKQTKTLYIAREDPARRLQQRILESAKSYGMNIGDIPRGIINILVRETLVLTEDSHLGWIADQVKASGCELLILDVLNRMIPGVDDGNVKEFSKIVQLIEGINRRLNIGILLVDHTRKPAQGRGSDRNEQEPNPFDLKGSVSKYGSADYMVMLSTTKKSGRLKVFFENKDHDRQEVFFLDVAGRDEADPETGLLIPKFQYAGDVIEKAVSMTEKAEQNRMAILNEVEKGIATAKDLSERLGFSRQTVANHLKHLSDAGDICKKGFSKNTVYYPAIRKGS